MSDQDVDPNLDDFAGLLQRLRETPSTLATLIDGLSDAEIRWRNSDGEFSALENICHLGDIEAEGYAVRINRLLNETNPVLADIDGSRLAVERTYNEQDPDLRLSAFAIARTRNLEMLNGLGTGELDRKGSLEGVGIVTLRRLAEMMLEHDESHLQDLRSQRHELKRRL